jgi:hypothetical protein
MEPVGPTLERAIWLFQELVIVRRRSPCHLSDAFSPEPPAPLQGQGARARARRPSWLFPSIAFMNRGDAANGRPCPANCRVRERPAPHARRSASGPPTYRS